MTTKDPFGLAREEKINASKVREYFTPHRPVHTFELFFGRQTEVQKLIEQINTPGQHSLLYGDRGVGKSSLASVACELILQQFAGKYYEKRCSSGDTFETILESPLRAAGVDVTKTAKTSTIREGGNAGLGVPGVGSAKVNTERSTTESFRGLDGELRASQAADLLAHAPGLLLVDEADAIRADDDKRRLAELMKLLSDANSPFKLLVVGVAETGEELTGAHPSVYRCLKETKLQRMSNEELALIIVEGARKVPLTFTKDVIEAIVEASAGYPHFCHLLALKCAEEAVATDQEVVNAGVLDQAIDSAVQEAEGTLRRMYDNAVRSYDTDKYKSILHASANIPTSEFTARTLRQEIERLTGHSITQNSLNNYLKKLVSDGNSTILRREAKGVYRFNDPRMCSYIKIAQHQVI